MSSIRRKPSVLLLGAALVALISLPEAAQAAPATPDDAHHPFAHLVRCLAVVNLTDAQKADVKVILEASKPQAETIAATLKADREALKADLEKTPPDPCAVGTDALKLHTDREAARTFFEGVRDQVLALLTPDQKAKLAGCLEAPPHVASLETGTGQEPTE